MAGQLTILLSYRKQDENTNIHPVTDHGKVRYHITLEHTILRLNRYVPGNTLC